MISAPDGAVGTGSLGEEEVFRRLAVVDVTGAREAMHRVLGETLAGCSRPAEASYLLFDLLSQMRRQVAGNLGLPPPCAGSRLEVMRRLAAAASQTELVSVFWSIWEEETSGLLPDSRVGHPAVDQVRAFVQANYQRKLALSEIARAVGISRNYLSHIFRKHCGVTVTEHIHRTRMRQAEKLLLSGERSVSEIAYMTGYQNYRDFHRNFVKYQKTSPKRFRQARARARRATAMAP